MDSRCNIESNNMIIYGHNMKNGTMFGSLRKYTDKTYLKEHPIIEFETQSGCVEYAIFAVVPVNKQDEWYCFIDVADEVGYEKQIQQIRGRSLHDTDILPEYGQQLLTLSTCYHSSDDGRLLVIAVKTQ